MASLLRTDKEIMDIYNRQVDTVYRICFSFMKTRADTEDMVQETFLRLMSNGTVFQSEKHEKAWLIVTASNVCKDALRRSWRKHTSIEELPEIAQEGPEWNPVLEAILALPRDQKTAVYMYYYEGYSSAEIAQALGCRQGTVRSRLSRARQALKKDLGGDA
ncbi:MAG: RNA polymerase sigma factor [Faecousia sp.]